MTKDYEKLWNELRFYLADELNKTMEIHSQSDSGALFWAGVMATLTQIHTVMTIWEKGE